MFMLNIICLCLYIQCLNFKNIEYAIYTHYCINFISIQFFHYICKITNSKT